MNDRKLVETDRYNLLRDLLLRSHLPIDLEIYPESSPLGQVVGQICVACGSDWPCNVKDALDFVEDLAETEEESNAS